MIKGRLKRIGLTVFTAGLLFGGSLWGQEQIEIANSGAVQVAGGASLSLSIKGVGVLTNKINKIDARKLAQALRDDVSNFIKTNDGLVKAKNTLTKTINNFKIKYATKLANKNWAMSKHLEKLEFKLSKVNEGFDDMKSILSDYETQGTKIMKNGKAFKIGTEILGGALDVISVTVLADEMLKAKDSGNDLRFKHKRNELLVTTGTTIGFIATVAGAAVTIPAGIAVGVGAVFNDMTENLKEQNREWSRNKINELDALLSKDNVSSYMNNELKRISKENITYTLGGVKDKLNVAFNTQMSQMLNVVNHQMDLINKNRIDLPLDGKGPLIRNEGELAVYNWLKGQKDILERLKLNLPFDKDAKQITSFRNEFINDVADKYIEYQDNFINSDEFKNTFDNISMAINQENKWNDFPGLPIVRNPNDDNFEIIDNNINDDYNDEQKNELVIDAHDDLSSDNYVPTAEELAEQERIERYYSSSKDYKGYFTKNILKTGTDELYKMEVNSGSNLVIDLDETTEAVINISIVDDETIDISNANWDSNDPDHAVGSVQTVHIVTHDNNLFKAGISNSNLSTYATSYTRWGQWAIAGGVTIPSQPGVDMKVEYSWWVAGRPTQDLPTTGSASYTGQLMGESFSAGALDGTSTFDGWLDGTMTMNVNFVNNNIDGTLNIKNRGTDISYVTASMNNMTINTTNNTFSGKLIGANIAVPQNSSQNAIEGRFYGPVANEIGGNWNIQKTDGRKASGIFLGKQ